jgi:hypothetical protein
LGFTGKTGRPKSFAEFVSAKIGKSTIKSTVLGGIKTKDENGKKKSGDDLKKEVEEAVYKIFPKNLFKMPYTNDVTDAISVAITYVIKNGAGTLGENKEEKKEKKKKSKSEKKTKS